VCFELNSAAPHRADPIENLDFPWERLQHRGQGKKAIRVGVHSDRKHVVRPNAHADEPDAHGCGNHHRVSENRFA